MSNFLPKRTITSTRPSYATVKNVAEVLSGGHSAPTTAGGQNNYTTSSKPDSDKTPNPIKDGQK